MRPSAWWLAVVLPAALAAQPATSKKDVALPDRLSATFVGAVHGALPPASCDASLHAQPPGSAAIGAFEETTSAQSPDGSGTFEIVVVSTCAAPFYQALFAHEPITAHFSFIDGTTGRTTLALTLANARLTHVDLVQGSTLGIGSAGMLKIGIASTQVTAGGAAASTLKRLRAPSIHVASTVLVAITPGAGETWASGGASSSAHLASISPAMDATFSDLSAFALTVHATVDAVTGMPTSNFQIALDPLTKALDAKTTQIKAAALAHATLTQAIVTLMGRQSATAGITLWLKSARLTTDQLSSSTESITISASRMTITDIGSGRTASSP
ncbi:MAG: hypothetical protein ACHQWU_05915 [Gemmatimonadales bacterium]